ncbi:MAG: hypothetical protein J0I12_07085, partial [Candidatus Eremiobacteraeota bacterium]|nr:hypothetical protein [Candidatus Eremiobacteraeota bacterium]
MRNVGPGLSLFAFFVFYRQPVAHVYFDSPRFSIEIGIMDLETPLKLAACVEGKSERVVAIS